MEASTRSGKPFDCERVIYDFGRYPTGNTAVRQSGPGKRGESERASVSTKTRGKRGDVWGIDQYSKPDKTNASEATAVGRDRSSSKRK